MKPVGIIITHSPAWLAGELVVKSKRVMSGGRYMNLPQTSEPVFEYQPLYRGRRFKELTAEVWDDLVAAADEADWLTRSDDDEPEVVLARVDDAAAELYRQSIAPPPNMRSVVGRQALTLWEKLIEESGSAKLSKKAMSYITTTITHFDYSQSLERLGWVKPKAKSVSFERKWMTLSDQTAAVYQAARASRDEWAEKLAKRSTKTKRQLMSDLKIYYGDEVVV